MNCFKLIEEECNKKEGYGYIFNEPSDTPEWRLGQLNAMYEVIRTCRRALYSRYNFPWSGGVDEKLFQVQQAIEVDQDRARVQLLATKEVSLS